MNACSGICVLSTCSIYEANTILSLAPFWSAQNHYIESAHAQPHPKIYLKMDMKLREIKKVSENEFPGDVELGFVLGCRKVLTQPPPQAHLILKTHLTHAFYKLGTLLPREGHDTTLQEERCSTDKPRGDWRCLPLPGWWETAYLRSSSGHGL